jgi:hypothetical protein
MEMEQPVPVPEERSFEGPVIEKRSSFMLEVDEEVDEHTCRTEMSVGSQISDACCTENLVEVDHETKQQEDLPLPENSTSRIRGSLKRITSEPLHVRDERGSWKCLPAPNMALIVRTILAQVEGTTGTTERKEASVRFGDLQIRSYSQTVGDNPSVSYGFPIQLDWEYEEHAPVGIDEWEDNRPRRRTLRQMVLSYYQRRNLLAWQYGVTDEEMKAAKKEAKKIKFERAITQAFISGMPVEAAIESFGRKANRFLKRGEQSSS